MLQRIQTLYLLVTGLLSGLIVFLFYFWTDNDGKAIFLFEMLKETKLILISLPIVFIISSMLSLGALFLFKRRNQQIILNRFNIIINFYLLGVIVYHLLIISGEDKFSEKGIGLFIPLVSIVLLAFANKSIIRDEKLVKSVDRLR